MGRASVIKRRRAIGFRERGELCSERATQRALLPHLRKRQEMDHDEAIPFIYMILMGVVAFAAFVWYATVHQWFSAKARGAQPSEDPAMNRTSHWRVFWALVCMALIWFHATPLQSGYGGGSRGSYWSYRFLNSTYPSGKCGSLRFTMTTEIKCCMHGWRISVRIGNWTLKEKSQCPNTRMSRPT